MSAVTSIFVHKEVWHEAGDRMQALIDRAQDALNRNLLHSRGSTVKRLRGPWGGQAVRLRWGRLRIPMSHIVGPAGESQLFIHQVGPRDRVYRVPAFRERLQSFHREIWSQASGKFLIRPEDAGYEAVQHLCSQGPLDTAEDLVEEAFLSDEQQRLLDAMLPFPKTWDEEAFVILGMGPPGCGKTILAVDAARTAAESGAYNVLLLVPSPRLRVLFEHELKAASLDVSTALPSGSTVGSAVTLMEFEPFYSSVVGQEVRGLDRERALDEWWVRLLGEPALKRWAKSHSEVRTLRFRRLIDAVLEDASGLTANRKDALDTHDESLYGVVRAFRAREAWMGLARRRRSESRLLLRSEIGSSAGRKLAGGDFWHGNLLILVDEAQDLVPAEWKALVDWVSARVRKGVATRLALLGDENQRISPTSFSWNEVKAHVASTFGVVPPPVTSVELPGSFRLSKRLAAIAGEVFHPSIMGRGKFREVARARPETLSDHGNIHVAVLPDAVRHTCSLLRKLHTGLGDQRLQVLMLEPPADLVAGRDVQNIDVLPARLAKGLEFSALGVIEPFGGAGGQLTYDRATVAYTSLTRSAKSLLCVLTPAEWRLVHARWQAHDVDPEFLDDSPSGLRRLRELLLEIVGEVDLDQQLVIAEAKLRDALEQLPAGGSDEDVAVACGQVTTVARRFLELGRPEQLGREFTVLLSRHGEPLSRMRADVTRLLLDGDWMGAITNLLLLGEIAAAEQICRGRPPRDEAEHLAGQMRDLIEREAGLQEAIRIIRAENEIAPEVSGAKLLDLELIRATQADLASYLASLRALEPA